LSIGSSRLCIFHFWSNEQLAASAEPLLHRQFASDFYALISSKDGNWQGFVFPEPFKLGKAKFDFDVDATEARFKSVSLEDIEFAKKADFSRATFDGKTAFRNLVFFGEAIFTYANFVGTLELQRTRFSKNVSFYRTRFGDTVLMRAYCAAHASFAEADFRGAAHFAGWRNINLSLKAGVYAISGVGTFVAAGGRPLSVLGKLRSSIALRARAFVRILAAARRSAQAYLGRHLAELRGAFRELHHRYRRTSPDTEMFLVFGGEVEFTGINFALPALVSFSDVDLSRAYIRGTNLRGARFLNVNWWQPRLGRNGLYDELSIAQGTARVSVED